MPNTALYVETVSNLLYLVVVWIFFWLMWQRYRSNSPSPPPYLGWLAAAVFALACGDSFHLLPRIYGFFSGSLESGALIGWLGFGRAASSFTLSFFYLFLLFYAMRKFGLGWNIWYISLVILCAVRVALLFFPQNNWFEGAYTPWKFYRNIPFALQGIGVIVLFLRRGRELPLLQATGYAIIASFIFYIGTLVGTLWSPAWGALMLPKTLAYVIALVLLYRMEFSPLQVPA